MADAFHVHAEVGIGCDADEGEIIRVGEVELEPAAELPAQRGLAELVMTEANLTGMDPEVTPQQLTQAPVGSNEAPLQLRGSHAGAPDPFVTRESRGERSARSRRN